MTEATAPDPDSRRQRPPRALDAPPVAGPARIRGRHRALVVSMLLLVVLPLLAIATYMGVFARDQYASTVGFTIRQEETGSASELAGGLAQMLGGGSAQGQGDLLFEFLRSQQIVERVAARFDLRAHYSENWPDDPVYSLWPTATIEDLVWFWGRMVRPSYDKATGLMLVEVRARDPQSARTIATLIVDESERMINALNENARADATRNAEADLNAALERLRSAREALAAFRARTQIVDPQADIQARMGVLSNLQGQLAIALVDHDLLLQNAEPNDPRLRQSERRIEAIRHRIREERRSFAEHDVTVDDTDYPTLIAQYESLQVDQTFAEMTYRSALTAREMARSNAERQSLYLATFIAPTLAQRAQHPRRVLLVGLTGFFLVLFWAVLALVYYSLRDRG